MKQINTWPEQERPREKLLKFGAEHLSDAELLALLIHSGNHNHNALEIARILLSQFGGLRQVITADRESLCGTQGIGPAKFALFKASREIGKRFVKQKLFEKPTINGVDDAVLFLTHEIRDLPYESFSVIYLNAQHRVLHFESLFKGTLNSATIYTRELIKNVLQQNAAAVIFAHNHPSGLSEPSQSDKQLTQRLCQALKMIDVKVLDHIVIGDGEYVAFSERNLLTD